MANVMTRMTTFFTELREEMLQVSWPTRDELAGSALVVFVGVTFLALYIHACNLLLSNVAKSLLR